MPCLRLLWGVPEYNCTFPMPARRICQSAIQESMPGVNMYEIIFLIMAVVGVVIVWSNLKSL